MSLVFAHPAIAALTVGLAAIPFVIHWLSRRRFRQEPWAAMAFLLSAQRRSRRRMTFEHWVLMVLRTLVILAVGLAIARPALSDSVLARTAAARFDRMILLDDTLSMQAHSESGRSTFEAARDAALRLIDGFSPRDGVAVVVLSGGGRALVDRPTIDRALLKRLVGQLTCSHSAANPADALGLAREVLERGDAPRDCRAVYMITDGQAATWRAKISSSEGAERSRETALGNELATRFNDLCSAEFRHVIDLAPERRGNVAVTALRPTSRWVGAGLPAMFVAEVSAFGMSLPPDAKVQWNVDGAIAATVPLGLPGASGVRRSEWPHRFSRPGSHVVRAKLLPRGDALAADDERFLAIDAAADVSVLMVSGESSGGPAGEPAFYPALALSSAGQRQRLFAVRTMADPEFRRAPLDDVRAIVLLNVRQLSAADWVRLARFVRAGGGLLVCLGDRIDSATYNTAAGPSSGGAKGSGGARDLIPLALDRAMVEGAESAGLLLRVEDWSHPLLADWSEHAGGGLLTTPFRGYVRASKEASGRTADARTLLSFANGEPALVEHSYGRGRVLLWMSSMQMDWSTLPAKPDFVPLWVNLAGYLAGADAQRQGVNVGQALQWRLPHRAPESGAEIRRPDGHVDRFRRIEPANRETMSGSPQARYERTNVPGIYVAQAAGRVESLAVNIDPAECDLLPLGEMGLRNALGGSFHYSSDVPGAVGASPAAPRREMSGVLIGLLLACVLLETLLAAWFGKD